MAGLACAQTLQQAGFLVTVFEKSRGPSGRVSTRQGEGWQADHGAQYFTVSQPAFALQVEQWLHAGVIAPWQGRLYETDGASILPKQGQKVRYVGIPKNTAPARHLAMSLEVALEHTVSSLSLDNKQWSITSKEHGVYPQRFDQMVLAIPAPQAHVLLKTVHASYAALAASVQMRGCWALMARYAHRLDVPYDGLFVNTGLLSWVARDSSKPGREPANLTINDVWVLHAAAAWSEANLEREADAVAAEMFAAFAELGGQASTDYSIHRWRYADSPQPLAQGCVWDATQQLGLCGDWLNGGKVEGAWMSGYLLASTMRSSSVGIGL